MSRKRCRRCLKTRSTRAFARATKAQDGRQSYCRDCNNAYRRARRGTHEDYRRSAVQSARTQRRKVAEEINKIKAETPCADCNLRWKPWQMQFDHVRGRKMADVATLVRRGSRKRALEEIAKCELVCANCHADRTHRRRHAGVAQSVER